MSKATFSDRILAWFEANGRKDLPWQASPDRYRVWVSEIMLQQTQVATVIPYYLRFIEAFPDLRTLANAPADEVLQHWAGLGYYARARNLHQAAKRICEQHAGVFPGEYDEVMALPGIGRSTAGAILSLADGARFPILDGNVKRVLARYRQVDGWPGKSSVAKQLWAISDELTPRSRVAAYNQAMMDLGATLCTRSQPACGQCPLHEDCAARIAGTQESFPARKSRKAKPLRNTRMVLAHAGGAVYLERRPPAGIWGGLWSLPELGEQECLEDWCAARLNAAPAGVHYWSPLRHSFSHYDLDIQPIAVRIDSASSKVEDADGTRWLQLHEALKVGLAAPVKKLIDILRNGHGSNGEMRTPR